MESAAPKVEKTVDFDDQIVRHCQFWNDGKWLVVATKNREETEIEVTVFDIQGGFGNNMPLVDKFTVPGRNPEFSLSPDNQHLALATNNYKVGSLTVRNVLQQKQAWRLEHPVDGWGYSASVFLNGGSQLLCSQRGEQIYQLYETESGAEWDGEKRVLRLTFHGKFVSIKLVGINRPG